MKYPYLRGVLLDLWRAARARHADPVDAWASLVDDPEARRRWQEARGKGGLRRASWEEALELIAASTIYTLKRHGADRVVGFSPIPAMSMLSYAGGSRFLQLLGAVNLLASTTGTATSPTPRRRSGASRPTWPRAPTGTTPSTSSRWART